MEVNIQSTITCPECGYRETLEMPQDACLYYHTCTHCGMMMRPAEGDCCVFCTHGSVPCPPVQKQRSCC